MRALNVRIAHHGVVEIVEPSHTLLCGEAKTTANAISKREAGES
jgi:hypothetical protein